MKGLFKIMTKDKLKNLLPLAKLCLEERGLAGVSTPEYCVDLMDKLYDLRAAGVYVDDKDNPLHVVVLTHLPDFWTSQTICTVSLMFSHPDHRQYDYVAEMLEVAHNYAAMNGCVRIVAASDNARLAPLLERHGFQMLEQVFKKEVNHG
jgi:hypothetical protein